VDYIREEHTSSISRACRIVGYSRSGMYYQSRKKDGPVQEKLQEWAEKSPLKVSGSYLAESEMSVQHGITKECIESIKI
jgi:uncharacterized protein YciW